ncbi:hypothetical protein AAG747_11965 [Rapidithrix thailandica]|uniref:Uncharacterized protein n=1 Tax=Rapidithrix thailandica TaxID=413964 RepID=A0AAW9SD40_9BACT
MRRTIRPLLIAVLGLLMSITPLIAQDQAFEEVYHLAKEKKNEEAVKALSFYVAGNHNNALANFLLAKLEWQKFKEMYYLDAPHFSALQDSLEKHFSRALANASRKDIRKNKRFYQELLKTKRPKLPEVKSRFEQTFQEFQTYKDEIDQLTQYHCRIKKHYLVAQNAYSSIGEQYSTMAELYFIENPNVKNDIENIAFQFDSLQTALKDYHHYLRIKKLVLHKQKFSFRQFNKFDAEKVTSGTFHEKNVLLFDYGTWAKNILNISLEKAKRIKQTLLVTDKQLSKMLQEVDTAAFPDEQLRAEHNQVITDLFDLDGNSLAAKILSFKQVKLDLLHYIKLHQTLSGQNKRRLSDNNHLEDLIHKNLKEADILLKNMSFSETELNKYREYIRQAYPKGEAGLESYIQTERLYVDHKILEYEYLIAKRKNKNRSDRQPMHSMEKISYAFPRVEYRKKTIALDVSNINLDSLLSFGGYAGTELVKLDNGGQLVAGFFTPNNSQQQDAFLAQIDSQFHGKWLRTFRHQTENGANCNDQIKMLSVKDDHSAMVLKSVNGEKVFYRIVRLDPQGMVKFDHMMEEEKVPRNISWVERGNEVLVVSKGQKQEDRFESLEDCFIERLDRMGNMSYQRQLKIRGLVGPVTPIRSGFVVMANFLEFVDGEMAIKSEAFRKGGFNVLLMLLNKAGELTDMIPLFSNTPIFANEINESADGTLAVKGVKGDFTFGGSGKVNGGEYWKLIVSEQQKKHGKI